MKILVAVAWPYVNGEFHLGHLAGAMLPADIFARFNRLIGNETLMVSGSDMHGTPTLVLAEKLKRKPIDLALENHKAHIKTLDDLEILFNLYTTTETKNHEKVVQELFSDLVEKGFIIKQKEKQFWSEKEKKFLLDRYIEGECPYCKSKNARGDQCENCGRTLTPTELINPVSIYGDKNLKLQDNEDFFLNLPKIEKMLTEWLDKHPNMSNWRDNAKNFTYAWLKEGLKPRAITRNFTFGVPLPEKIQITDKEKKVIYVWFEAVTGYWSASVEWADRIKSKKYTSEKLPIQFNKFNKEKGNWKAILSGKDSKHYYFIGKDNIVFHTIIWPAMLLGWNFKRKENEKINLPWDVPANAFLNLEGKKMSKSRKWFVGVRYLIDNYGVDLVRYYFASRMPENKDSDFRWKDFIEANNNELVGNLGNFIHRTLTFVESKLGGRIPKGKIEKEVEFEISDAFSDSIKFLEKVKISESINRIMRLTVFANKYFDKNAVWKVIKEDEKEAENILFNCIQIIEAFRILLIPFMPQAVRKLSKMLDQKEVNYFVGKNNYKFVPLKAGKKIDGVEVLFKKIDEKIIEEEVKKLGK